MNTKTKTLPARFEEPSRFEAPLPFRSIELNELERFSERLLREYLIAAAGPDEPALLRRAANEATALAATTAYPLLLFPGLFDEKLAAARVYASRQAKVWERSRVLLSFAE